MLQPAQTNPVQIVRPSYVEVMRLFLIFESENGMNEMAGYSWVCILENTPGKQSRDQAIFIAEKSFACIEPTIKECSIQFSKKYSHWGVTEILRDEWSESFPDLDN